MINNINDIEISQKVVLDENFSVDNETEKDEL